MLQTDFFIFPSLLRYKIYVTYISAMRGKLKNRSATFSLDFKFEQLLHSKVFCSCDVGGTKPGWIFGSQISSMRPLKLSHMILAGIAGPQ